MNQSRETQFRKKGSDAEASPSDLSDCRNVTAIRKQVERSRINITAIRKFGIRLRQRANALLFVCAENRDARANTKALDHITVEVSTHYVALGLNARRMTANGDPRLRAATFTHAVKR